MCESIAQADDRRVDCELCLFRLCELLVEPGYQSVKGQIVGQMCLCSVGIGNCIFSLWTSIRKRLRTVSRA